jgi:hypothetical protein
MILAYIQFPTNRITFSLGNPCQQSCSDKAEAIVISLLGLARFARSIAIATGHLSRLPGFGVGAFCRGVDVYLSSLAKIYVWVWDIVIHLTTAHINRFSVNTLSEEVGKFCKEFHHEESGLNWLVVLERRLRPRDHREQPPNGAEDRPVGRMGRQRRPLPPAVRLRRTRPTRTRWHFACPSSLL